ncbi:alpha/beta hydrolase fold domain-containing protein [Stemphylium lycopersici]|uniref:Alpha/beta hydrolase fold domain-containing protein n=1 Tax=Stemphylium lycopersici TaxID=183478 RepID=A0A364MYZ0_STELY|nr:alpha/beta hydrolase fold domain-containing protein [Stemphylium lycopersici]RAR07433.1 alpha/beta hydrolase fold domain-containing protein [Stemphylium lycopersici]
MTRRRAGPAQPGKPNSANNPSNNAQNVSTSQAGSWFSKFPPFLYDPTAGLKSNFDRLAADRKWGKKLQKKRWAECQEEEFGHAYGSDFTKLEAWQNLCIEVYIINPPDSIKQCKNVLGSRNVLVNLVNLIDHRNIGVKVIRFKSYHEFQQYTRNEKIEAGPGRTRSVIWGAGLELPHPQLGKQTPIDDLPRAAQLTVSSIVGKSLKAIGSHYVSPDDPAEGDVASHAPQSSSVNPRNCGYHLDKLYARFNGDHHDAAGERVLQAQRWAQAVQTIIYFHGYPSSRYEGKLWHSSCATHNLRLIAPDRPGNGLSTFQHNRRILDFPADVLALAEHLKIHQFYILGVSGGAPYALACIKEIAKERLLGASIVSGLYPVKLGTTGMMLPSRIVLWIAPWMTNLTTALFDTKMGKPSRNEDPTAFEEMLAKDVEDRHPGDQEAIRGSTVWPTYVAMTRESFHHGSDGAAWEAKLNGSDWGFELAHVHVGESGVPLTLWHSKDDKDCPVAMAEKAKDLLPGCALRVNEGEHFSFIARDTDDILANLVGDVEKEEYMMVNIAQPYA